MIEFDVVDKVPQQKWRDGTQVGKYNAIIDALREGKIVAVDGDNKIRMRLYNATLRAGLNVRTSIRDGKVYFESK